MYKTLTQWLVNRFISGADDVNNPLVRKNYGLTEGYLSIGVNSLLFIVKLLLGLIVNSISLIADALHSLSDTATSIVVIVGFRMASKPADREHPYGHGRAEYIATLIIAILLVVVGFEFIKSSASRIITPVEIDSGPVVLLAVFFTIVLKEVLGQISKQMGETIGSDTLMADFWHHRTDAISSGLVLVALLGGEFGMSALDGYAGIGVAAIMIYSGYDIARRAIDSLLGKPPQAELIQKIRALAISVDNVLDIHDIVVHSYGVEKFINLHVEMDKQLDPMTLHDTAEEVEKLLEEHLHSYALVHMDPIDVDSDDVNRIRRVMQSLVDEEASLEGFHELRVVDSERYKIAIMDIILPPRLSRTQSEQYSEALREKLSEYFPDYEFRLQVTPIHRYK